MEVLNNISLRELNTFGMDVTAACFVEYASPEELISLFPTGHLKGNLPQPWFHIGGGSNLLFTKDFHGTILHSTIRFFEETAGPDMKHRSYVRIGSGVIWDEFVAWSCRQGLWGAENLSLIPGETGAAAVQNIGAYGMEVADLILNVECFEPATGKFITIPAEDCGYAYRESRFKNEWKGKFIVTSVTFSLSRERLPQLDYGKLRPEIEATGISEADLTPMAVRNAIISIRNSKLPDPERTGSAGSFFRNPFVEKQTYDKVARIALAEGLGEVPHFPSPDGLIKIPAAWLIDKCGWKGTRTGNAGVWEKQPLVLVNATGKASPAEILELEDSIINSVRKKFSIILEPEVEHIR